MEGLVLADAPYGVFQRGSSYRINLEVFEFLRDANELQVRFPQTGKKATLRYRTTRCSDHPPFDLCLEIDQNPWQGPRRYYGFRDEAGAGRFAHDLHAYFVTGARVSADGSGKVVAIKKA